MVVTDALEGVINKTLWFHYDIGNDVLYLRRNDRRDAQAVGEDTPDGMILLRDAETDDTVGLTVVNWWRRFGRGELPDSISELAGHIEPFGQKMPAGAA